MPGLLGIMKIKGTAAMKAMARPKNTMAKPLEGSPTVSTTSVAMVTLSAPPICRNMPLIPVMVAALSGRSSMQALFAVGDNTPTPTPNRNMMRYKKSTLAGSKPKNKAPQRSRCCL